MKDPAQGSMIYGGGFAEKEIIHFGKLTGFKGNVRVFRAKYR